CATRRGQVPTLMLEEFLEMLVAKHAENTQTHVSLAQRELWFGKLINPSYGELPYRPTPVLQSNTPHMIPGKFYHGIGVFAGYGVSAKPFLAGQDLEIVPLKEDASFVADKTVEEVK